MMSEAMASLTLGEVHQPLRQIVRPPGAKGLLGLMPAYIGGAEPVYGAKTGGFFPDNSAIGLDPHQGCVLLFSGDTGALMAVMSASEITGIRTAAMTGLATRLLARPEASRLALIGCGHQAHRQLQAVAAVRSLRSVKVVARRPESARTFVAAEQPVCGFSLEAVDTVEAAVRDADIVVTITNAREPVLRREWIAPGVHINAVGSSTPSLRDRCRVDGPCFAVRRPARVHAQRVGRLPECRPRGIGDARESARGDRRIDRRQAPRPGERGRGDVVQIAGDGAGGCGDGARLVSASAGASSRMLGATVDASWIQIFDFT